jgi:galactose-1-phosphate uridylyltransferase
MDLKKEIEEAVFLDPYNEFKEKRLSIEKRTDPLSGLIGRLVTFRFRLPEAVDLNPTIEKSLNVLCPFCPDQVEKRTPKLLPSLAEEGRLVREEALLVPNFFPYEPNSAVIRLTETHCLSMAEFTADVLLDGIMVSVDYMKRIYGNNPAVRYGSINWNYMPPAGGGLVHPHLQTVASSLPTRYTDQLMKNSARYFRNEGKIFWEDYIEEEETREERFMGRIGRVSFLSPFVPANMMGEVMAIFEGQQTAWEDTEGYASSFCDGLTRTLRCWSDLHFTSFNMTLYLFFEPEEGAWSIARIVPRVAIQPLGTSDVNYYEKLHGETFCVFSPENMCSRLLPYFDG